MVGVVDRQSSNLLVGVGLTHPIFFIIYIYIYIYIYYINNILLLY